MRLLSLKVTHFGCVASARVEFGPGLNILFGPNDLGKSSLIGAIRAALLLPHASSAYAEYVPWASDRTPQVELVFQIDAAFYRIRKTFGAGSRGASLLDGSKDGENWVEEAAARAVDGALRKLLRWGLHEPGGRSGPRGLPESFLTTLLLPSQAAVTAVFERDISGDADESGRERLAEALQAMARDERFTDILARAQVYVDEAFTPTGQWKRGKDAPAVHYQRRMEEKRAELARWEEAAKAGSSAAAMVRRLSEQRAEQRQRAEQAAVWQQRCEAIALARERLVTAQADLAAREQLTAAAARGEQHLSALESALAAAQQTLLAATQESGEARQRLAAARDDRRLRGAEAVAQECQLRGQELTNRRLVLEQTDRACTARRQEAQRAVQAAAGLAGCERQLAEAVARQRECAGSGAEAEQHLRRAEQQVALLTQVDVLLKVQALERELAHALAAAAEATQLRQRAAVLIEQHEQLRQAVLAAPQRAQVEAVRTLAENLRVAMARAGVGTCVRLEPRYPIDAEVGSDGGAWVVHREVANPLTIEASREIVVRLPNIATLRATAGSAGDRRELLALEERWQREATPLLERHACADVDALVACAVRASEDHAAAERLQREAEGLLARARDLDLQRQAVAHVDRDAIDRACAGIDQPAAAAVLAALPEPPERALAQRLAAAQAARAQAAAAAQQFALEAARCEERVKAAGASEQSARAAMTAVAAAFAGRDPAAVEAESVREQAAIASELAAIDCDVAEAQDQADRAAAAARVELADAVREEAAAEQREASARAGHDEARRLRDEHLGAQRRLRDDAAAIDLSGPRHAVTAATEALATLTAGSDVDEDALRRAAVEAAAARTQLEQIERELLRAEGALKEVGGVVAIERAEALRASLHRIDAESQECALNFEAWRLLVATLKEAEGEEAVHLGRAVMPRVKSRFEELTHSRYGELALGPNLEAQGIVVRGGTRSLGALSIGTQEQLSTIFRLALADQLCTAVILDDQLTQTDPQRMRWFRAQLKQSATRIQVIVVTCHADDYLEAGEVAEDGAVKDTGIVRAIDLERLVVRA